MSSRQSPVPEGFEELTMSMVKDLEQQDEDERRKITSDPATPAPPQSTDKAETPSAAATAAAEDEELDILGSGAITKKVIRKGEDDTRPLRGQEVTVVASCTVDGVSVYEDKEFTLRVGEGDVCMAWDILIPLMDVGEIAQCKSSYRFDKQATAKEGSAITYKLELKSVRDTKDDDEMTKEERVEQAAIKKNKGNEYFRLNDLDSAAASFKRAIALLKPREGEEGLKDLTDAIIPCWNNLALVQMKAESYVQAFESLEEVLKIDPNNEKALFRKAKCHLGKHNVDDALAILTKIAPGSTDPAVRAFFEEVKTMKRNETAKEKELYKKMVSALDGSSPDVLKRDKEIAEEKRAKEAEAAVAAESSKAEAANSKKMQIIAAVVMAVLSIFFFYLLNNNIV